MWIFSTETLATVYLTTKKGQCSRNSKVTKKLESIFLPREDIQVSHLTSFQYLSLPKDKAFSGNRPTLQKNYVLFFCKSAAPVRHKATSSSPLA